MANASIWNILFVLHLLNLPKTRKKSRKLIGKRCSGRLTSVADESYFLPLACSVATSWTILKCKALWERLTRETNSWLAWTILALAVQVRKLVVKVSSSNLKKNEALTEQSLDSSPDCLHVCCSTSNGAGPAVTWHVLIGWFILMYDRSERIISGRNTEL